MAWMHSDDVSRGVFFVEFWPTHGVEELQSAEFFFLNQKVFERLKLGGSVVSGEAPGLWNATLS